jgi:PAS domain S-box-containing protein
MVALTAAFVFTWPVALLSTFFSVYRPDGVLAALDYGITLQSLRFWLGLFEAVGHALVLQVVFWVVARSRPVAAARRSPPYARTLSSRFLFALIPILLLMTVVLIYAAYDSAVSGATRQAVASLMRDADNGADGISYFLSTGQSMAEQFASDPVLWEENESVCTERLSSNLEMLTYFSRLTAYDLDGSVLCTYPPSEGSETVLTAAEIDLLQFSLSTGSLPIAPAHRGADGQVHLSFLSPLEDPRSGQRYGVLVGRVQLGTSPMLRDVLGRLQGTMGQGEGLVIDEGGRIIAYPGQSTAEMASPEADRFLEYWTIDQTGSSLAEGRDGLVWVRQSRDSTTNARQLVCYSALDGYPWAVVITLPHRVVLQQAIALSGPLLAILIGLSLVVGFVIFLVTNQLTRPLDLLAKASARIAAGNLEQAILLGGDDEVSRLGDAFEKMRVGLKDRLDDLSLLLRVGQEVSAALDLASGMPPLLEGALQATDALVSRVVMLSVTGEPQVVMGRGETIDGLSVLDRALGLNARDVDRPLVIENLSRARSLAESGDLPEGIQAAVALPVRGKGRTVAVMWVGYPEPRRFKPTEIDLLSTLANQTAVLVENARLFQMAEGGRRRLAAILASTSDAVLVTDRDNHLLLLNPAAEQVLGLKASEVMDRDIGEVPLDPALIRILTEPMERTDSLVDEVSLSDRRTFYAIASKIQSAEAERIGRVVVMRDVTHFKELDEMKSEFVSTVSHDLRTPLTFMRGYASMLPMVGELNEKQQEYMEKILTGVEQMGTLVEDLLNLGRIEAGVGLEEKPCHIGALVVEAVESMRTRAAAKGLVVNMKSSDPAPVILGDVTLLRQAVANLVDNAIKYTPTGGTVSVGLSATEDEVLISVTDTGIGIAPEDQVRLFEKFYRVRRQETKEVQGTGLGLAIVKSIIERHGGRVRVDSVLNQGSTFTIELPVRTSGSSDR